MTFNKVTQGSTCDCLNGTVEDTSSTYARVLNKESVTDSDFMSKWEKNHRSADCGKICGLKGISVSKIANETVKEKIVKQYSQIFKISPNYRRGVLLFKLKGTAAVIKETPSKGNEHHNDLYKSDVFELNLIEEVETCYLTPVVRD